MPESEVQLPLIDSDTALVDALERATEHGTSGVVVRGGGGHHVIHVRHLLLGLRSQGNVAVGTISAATDRAVPGSSLELIGSDFARVKVQGIEQFNLTTSTILCRCPLDPSHYWAPDELAVPGQCNVDGAKVTCK